VGFGCGGSVDGSGTGELGVLVCDALRRCRSKAVLGITCFR
jgi:hypothetical protein